MGATPHVRSEPLSRTIVHPPANANAEELAAASRRRMMRAAWAISEDRGCSFAEAMEEARAHEESRPDFRDDLNPDTNCILDVVRELLLLYPVDDYRFLTRNERSIIGDVIDRLIGALDRSEGDTDLESEADHEPDADAEYEYTRPPPSAHLQLAL